MLPFHLLGSMNWATGKGSWGLKKKKQKKGSTIVYCPQSRRDRISKTTSSNDFFLDSKIFLFRSNHKVHHAAAIVANSHFPSAPLLSLLIFQSPLEKLQLWRNNLCGNSPWSTSLLIRHPMKRWSTVSGSYRQKTQLPSPIHPLLNNTFLVRTFRFSTIQTKNLIFRGALTFHSCRELLSYNPPSWRKMYRDLTENNSDRSHLHLISSSLLVGVIVVIKSVSFED